jgi:hypothetical protein
MMRTSTWLFGDGKHGQTERIQTFRCQACRTTFTSRCNPPLYRLKTPSRAGSLRCSLRLSEGLDPSESAQATITSLSLACCRARTDPARALLPQPAYPASAVGRTAHQAAQRQPDSSFSGWPSIRSPRLFRCLGSARAPKPWPIDSSTRCDRAWPPFCLPLFTSDGLNLYFYALTAHFGQ